MFRLIGTFATRLWPAVLLGWIALLIVLYIFAPSWEQVGKSGQFSYLPADSPTRRAEAVFERAFPGQRAASTIVAVVTRTDDRILQPSDYAYINGTLALRLSQQLLPEGRPSPGSVVERILAPGDGPVGELLKSQDRRAAMVVIDLSADFLDSRNWPVVAFVEQQIDDLRQQGLPGGLRLTLTGSAVIGRDSGLAEAHSAQAVQHWTIIVVVALLATVYRAPLLAAIPLLTVFVAIEVALRLLSSAAQAWNLDLYQGVSIYVTIVGYGAGVDYCLFLISRCKEQWRTQTKSAGVQEAVSRIGPAITASAATVIVGIAMMGFAQFGKIKQAGLGIAFSLAIVLLAALTLAPALLCMSGRWALWPYHRQGSDLSSQRTHRFWQGVGRALSRRPAIIGLAAIAVLAPFAGVGAARAGRVSYDYVWNLPANAPGEMGLKILREHFTAGETGLVTALIENDRIDFRTARGIAAIRELTDRLKADSTRLQLADIRSLADPVGIGQDARQALAHVSIFAAATGEKQAQNYYVGGAGGHVTRLVFVLARDPFTRHGLNDLDTLEKAVRSDLPPELHEGSQVMFLGTTPSIRDLQEVTTSDEWRVDILVVVAVFLVLLILLRRPLLAAYLIVSVVFGYLTTLGLTYLVCEWRRDGSFPGLDWRVPLFLFTILIAVGEDYNIFLLTRVREEILHRGTVEGVIHALGQTGGVITSCGLIMAGTFASLFAGTLAEMREMAFALSCGVLLDTLVIRPVLVPAFLLLVECWHGCPKPHEPKEEAAS